MNHRPIAGRLAVSLLAVVAACSASDTVAVGGDGGPPGSDGATSGADAGLWDTYCDGDGPPVFVGDGGDATDVCSGDIAEATFEHALCSCLDLSLSANLFTDSFDSSVGPYTPGGTAGAVASNGTVQSNASIDVRGDLTGALGVWVASTGNTSGNLVSGGDLGDPTADVTVGGDATVAGNVSLTNLTVGGALTAPTTSTISVTGTSSFGMLTRAPVAVAPPCACDAGDLLDVAGFVAAHRDMNHNQRVPMSADHLASFSGPTELSLPCGLYYLTGIDGTGQLTITATGRVALFVDGDVNLDDVLRIRVPGAGELDLFVTGAITSSAAMELGDPARPSALRIYLGSTAVFDVAGNSTVAGNLYAPQSQLSLSGITEVYGALFARRIAASSGLTIHYDERVRSSGEDCPIVN